jgi:hypothetical protein
LAYGTRKIAALPVGDYQLGSIHQVVGCEPQAQVVSCHVRKLVVVGILDCDFN